MMFERVALITYDSTLIWVPDFYLQNSVYVTKFTEELTKYATLFAKEFGFKVEDVSFEIVWDSDWCKNMTVFYTSVPVDFEFEGSKWDESYCETWYPNWVRTTRNYIVGRGTGVDVTQHPPTNPHNSFRTIKTV